MTRAIILPDDQEAAADPAAKQVLETARSEITARPPDSNEGSHEFNVGTEMAARQTLERERAATEAPQTDAGADDADVPPEFRGKSKAELVSEYRRLHSEIGRQGSELGEWRRQAPLLAAAPVPPTPATPNDSSEPVDEVEFFAQPAKAIEKAISQHPILKSLKTAAVEALQTKSSEQFSKEFPEAEKTMADPEFRQWVSTSKIRTGLLLQAHQDYDLDAAREVFGNWQALRGGSANGAKQPAKTRVYRRRDVQALMETDPARYQEMEPEIRRAYAEKRIRDI